MKERKENGAITDGVRQLSRQILETSGDIISIDENKLYGLAKKLEGLKSTMTPGANPFANEELSPEDELGFNLYFNVVNFCYMNPVSGFEYAYMDKAGKIKKRSTGLNAAMAESGIHWGYVLDVSHLSSGDWEETTQLNNNPDFYLGAERGKRIVYFARILRDIGFNKASDLLEFAGWESGKILHFLGKSGYFNDEFAKRSQLAVSMMDMVLKRRFGRHLEGTDTLTVMADYRLPQVMYNFEVVRLNEGILSTLKAQKPIESGSREESALRAACVVVGAKLSSLLDIPEKEVDTLLWLLSQEMAKNGALAIPHMIVATDKY